MVGIATRYVLDGGTNPGGGEIFRTRPDRLGAHLASYAMDTASFPVLNSPGHVVDRPPLVVPSLKKE